MRPVAILALLATLAACTPTYSTTGNALTRDARPDSTIADGLARAVFDGRQNCTPGCFEIFKQSGCDYDCRKKETLR